MQSLDNKNLTNFHDRTLIKCKHFLKVIKSHFEFIMEIFWVYIKKRIFQNCTPSVFSFYINIKQSSALTQLHHLHFQFLSKLF